jgi:glycerol-3-phosphate dehydrogenase
VVRFSAERSLLDRLTPETAILAGEIVYAAEHAEALDLSDAVLRRTPLGSAGHPGRAAIDRAATLMAQALGWSQAERDAQIARLERAYPEP